MGISKKTLLIVASILGTIILSLFFYLQFFVLRQYADIEKVEISNKIVQSVKAFNKSSESQTAAALVFSLSGETFDFLKDEDFYQNDFFISKKILQDMDIDFFTLIDEQKNVRFAAVMKDDSRIEYMLGESFKNEIIVDKYLASQKNSFNGVSGVVSIGDVPYMIISKPVLDNKNPDSGVPAGTLLTGFKIDREIADALTNSLRSEIDIYYLGLDETKSRFSEVIQNLNNGNSYDIDYFSANEVAGYTFISDLNSNPVLLIEVISPRDIYIAGRNNIYTFFTVIFLTGLISCLTIFLILEKSVLSRIVKLSKDSEEIGKRGDILKTIPYRGNDEISRLTISINRMLRAISRNQLDILKSEKRFKDLVELLPEIVIESDIDYRLVFANQSFFTVFKYNDEDVKKGLYLHDLLKEKDFKRVTEETEKLELGSKTPSAEYTAIKKYGGTFPILLSSVATFSEFSVLSGFRSIAVDITDRKREEEQLRELEDRWEFALEGSGDGVWDWNFETNQFYYSRRLKELLGYDELEFKNDINKVMDSIHPQDLERVTENINKHLNGESRYYNAEYRIRKRDGSYIWAQDRGKVIRWDGEGKPIRMIGTFTDITVRKELEEEIKRLAYKDPLTNLPNRLLFNDRIELTTASSKRNNKRFALVIMDIDRFKVINDTYGHDVGDKLILYIGNKISETLRKSDTIARFGGDEFLLLLPDIKDRDDIEKIVKKDL